MTDYLKSLFSNPEQVVQAIKPLFVLFIIPYFSILFNSKSISSTKTPSSWEQKKVLTWFISTYTYTLVSACIWLVMDLVFGRIDVDLITKCIFLILYLAMFLIITKLNYDNYKDVKVQIELNKSQFQQGVLCFFNVVIALVTISCFVGMGSEIFEAWNIGFYAYIIELGLLIVFAFLFLLAGVVPTKNTRWLHLHKLEIGDRTFNNIVNTVKRKKELDIKYEGENGDIVIETVICESMVGVKRYYNSTSSTDNSGS